MGALAKLQAVQAVLKAPKGQYNSFGKYSYRSCEDILEAVKPILAEQKATIIITDSIETIGGRFYVKATAKFYDTETDEAPIENQAFAREPEDKKGADVSQITGASSSYARKYALSGLLLIDDSQDADTTNDGEEGRFDVDQDLVPHGEGMTPARVQRLQNEIQRVGADVNKLLAYYKKERVVDLSEVEYITAMNSYLRTPDGGARK